MKKLFLSLVAALVSTTFSFAQSSLLATLSHDGEISVFQGAGSLKQAMAAATHGDIITLASGRYDAAKIDKAITLRGAGIEEDSISGAFATRIIGSFGIQIPDSVSEHLSIEGIYNGETVRIYGTLNNAMLQKSRFSVITYDNSTTTKVNSLTVIHCRIGSYISFPSTCSVNFINSFVSDPYNQSGGNMEFTNCIISYDIRDIRNSLFTNCIFLTPDFSYSLDATNMASYCAAYIRGGGSAFENVATLTNQVLSQSDYNELFKAGTFYELTDAAKSKYVGNDGTEMGIYGGNLPYSWRILSPQITKCNVAAKTTADGKLSVDIEVKAAE